MNAHDSEEKNHNNLMLINEMHQKQPHLKSSCINLKELIAKLHEAFETNDVDIDYVQDLMAAYKSNFQEWKKFAKFDRYR